jgi:hypothetical protein
VDTPESANGRRIPLHLPKDGQELLAAALRNNRILFLDAAGNISILSSPTGRTENTLFLRGALDAVFIDDENILLGRSGSSGEGPFFKMNIRTGETVPLSYPASVGVRVYQGGSGTSYGAAIVAGGGLSTLSSLKTVLLSLNLQYPANSSVLAEYQGEDTDLSLAECGGIPAATLGGDGAVLYTSQGEMSLSPEILPFTRSPGLPRRLEDGGQSFIVVDSAGNLVWHDSHSAEIRAILRLYEEEWVLERSDGNLIRGRLTTRGAYAAPLPPPRQARQDH